jgi:hypothetical protein
LNVLSTPWVAGGLGGAGLGGLLGAVTTGSSQDARKKRFRNVLRGAGAGAGLGMGAGALYSSLGGKALQPGGTAAAVDPNSPDAKMENYDKVMALEAKRPWIGKQTNNLVDSVGGMSLGTPEAIGATGAMTGVGLADYLTMQAGRLAHTARKELPNVGLNVDELMRGVNKRWEEVSDLPAMKAIANQFEDVNRVGTPGTLSFNQTIGKIIPKTLEVPDEYQNALLAFKSQKANPKVVERMLLNRRANLPVNYDASTANKIMKDFPEELEYFVKNPDSLAQVYEAGRVGRGGATEWRDSINWLLGRKGKDAAPFKGTGFKEVRDAAGNITDVVPETSRFKPWDWINNWRRRTAQRSAAPSVGPSMLKRISLYTGIPLLTLAGSSILRDHNQSRAYEDQMNAMIPADVK